MKQKQEAVNSKLIARNKLKASPAVTSKPIKKTNKAPAAPAAPPPKNKK